MKSTIELLMIAVWRRHPSGSFDSFIHENDSYFVRLHPLFGFRIAAKIEVGIGEH